MACIHSWWAANSLSIHCRLPQCWRAAGIKQDVASRLYIPHGMCCDWISYSFCFTQSRLRNPVVIWQASLHELAATVQDSMQLPCSPNIDNHPHRTSTLSHINVFFACCNALSSRVINPSQHSCCSDRSLNLRCLPFSLFKHVLMLPQQREHACFLQIPVIADNGLSVILSPPTACSSGLVHAISELARGNFMHIQFLMTSYDSLNMELCQSLLVA
jgi:hypothetical protein